MIALTKTRVVLLFVYIGLIAGFSHQAIGQYTTGEAEKPMFNAITTIDEAREAAAQRFNLLLAPLQISNPLDHRFYPISTLSAADFKLVEERGNVWILIHEPLAGTTVKVAVGKENGLVQFDPLEVSVE